MGLSRPPWTRREKHGMPATPLAQKVCVEPTSVESANKDARSGNEKHTEHTSFSISQFADITSFY